MTASANNSPNPTAKAEKTSRWVLYHGTSTHRLKSIQQEDRLRISPCGNTVVSLTTDEAVAQYWACVSASADKRWRKDENAIGVVLRLDGEKLLEERHRLECYAVDAEDIKSCANGDAADRLLENEIICAKDITPLTEFLLDALNISKSTYETYLQHGRGAFMSPVPFIGNLEWLAMDMIIHQWGEEAFPGELDTMAIAIKGMRHALAELRQSRKFPPSKEHPHDQ